VAGDESFVQLDLFTPHRLDLGEAWDALAALELDRAMALFDGILARYPDSGEAAHGASIARHWSEVLAAPRSLPPGESVSAIWKALGCCQDELMSQRLRARLVQHLWATMVAAGILFIAPDLPAGRLALMLDRPADASRSLLAALRAHPDEPVVLDWLARSERALGHAAAAQALWTRLLLVAPEALDLETPLDPDVAEVVARHGKEWAPVRGWIEGAMPLGPPLPEHLRHTEPQRVHALLVDAEAAREAGDHDAMIARRLALHAVAPAVLAAYLDRLG
jgi:hypothetical protein